jgi:hypothetical protein
LVVLEVKQPSLRRGLLIGFSRAIGRQLVGSVPWESTQRPTRTPNVIAIVPSIAIPA